MSATLAWCDEENEKKRAINMYNVCMHDFCCCCMQYDILYNWSTVNIAQCVFVERGAFSAHDRDWNARLIYGMAVVENQEKK